MPGADRARRTLAVAVLALAACADPSPPSVRAQDGPTEAPPPSAAAAPPASEAVPRCPEGSRPVRVGRTWRAVVPPRDDDGILCTDGTEDRRVVVHHGVDTTTLLKRYRRHYGSHDFTVTEPGPGVLRVDDGTHRATLRITAVGPERVEVEVLRRDPTPSASPPAAD